MCPPVSKSIPHVFIGNSSNARNLGSESFLKNLQMATHSCVARPTIHHYSTFDMSASQYEKSSSALASFSINRLWKCASIRPINVISLENVSVPLRAEVVAPRVSTEHGRGYLR